MSGSKRMQYKKLQIMKQKSHEGTPILYIGKNYSKYFKEGTYLATNLHDPISCTFRIIPIKVKYDMNNSESYGNELLWQTLRLHRDNSAKIGIRPNEGYFSQAKMIRILPIISKKQLPKVFQNAEENAIKQALKNTPISTGLRFVVDRTEWIITDTDPYTYPHTSQPILKMNEKTKIYYEMGFEFYPPSEYTVPCIISAVHAKSMYEKDECADTGTGMVALAIKKDQVSKFIATVSRRVLDYNRPRIVENIKIPNRELDGKTSPLLIQLMEEINKIKNKFGKVFLFDIHGMKARQNMDIIIGTGKGKTAKYEYALIVQKQFEKAFDGKMQVVIDRVLSGSQSEIIGLGDGKKIHAFQIESTLAVRRRRDKFRIAIENCLNEFESI